MSEPINPELRDEYRVLKHWRNYIVSYDHDQVTIILGPERVRFSGPKVETWKAAEEWIQQRRDEISKLREQIAVVDRILNSYVSHGGEVWEGIRKNLEETLAAKKAGMHEIP